MKKTNQIVATTLLLTILGGATMMTGCSSAEQKEAETTTTTVNETQTEVTEEEETTEETQGWSPADAGLYSQSSLEDAIAQILFDPTTLTNQTLISYADQFTDEGLDLIILNDYEMDDYKKDVVIVEQGFKATNTYVEYTHSANIEEITSIVSAYAVSFSTSDGALDFYNHKVEEFLEDYPDATIEKTEAGMSFEYSDDEALIWAEYNEADCAVVFYEEYQLF